MKRSLLSQIACLLLVTTVSCKDEPVKVKDETTCQIEKLSQFETGATVAYKENAFQYEGSNIIRMDTKTRGIADGNRRITYLNGKVKSVMFYDKDNKLLIEYNFLFDSASGRLKQTAINYLNQTPTVSANYQYSYDDQGRLVKQTYYHNGGTTHEIIFTYHKENNTEIIRSETFDLSPNDPNYRFKSGKNEYVYDDKPSPNQWPAFTWNQYHQSWLDLTLPPSKHNLTKYTHYSLRSLSEEEPVWEIDESVSFTTDITYTQSGYPLTIIQKKANGQLKYEYNYSNCSK